jgi:hypothetical protein
MDGVMVQKKKQLQEWIISAALIWVCLFALPIFSVAGYSQQNPSLYGKGKILYENNFSGPEQMEDWKMEGPGSLEFIEGWMHMYAPEEIWHHVFWCPADFPDRFIAEWKMQNLNSEAGLCIVFFAATGLKGEDIFDPSLPERDGTFRYYTKDRLKSYHISYYANNPKNKEREASHLRKNNMFEIVQVGPEGIPKHSTEIHHIQLIKDGNRIIMNIDGDKIIDWTDDGKSVGPVYKDGKIGFRQMQWSHFRYRDFKVWGIKHK